MSNKRRFHEEGETRRDRPYKRLDQDPQRKRRRNSSEYKPQDTTKKQRRERWEDDHAIDTKYPEWHDKEGHFNYRLVESFGDVLHCS